MRSPVKKRPAKPTGLTEPRYSLLKGMGSGSPSSFSHNTRMEWSGPSTSAAMVSVCRPVARIRRAVVLVESRTRVPFRWTMAWGLSSMNSYSPNWGTWREPVSVT